MRLYLAGPMSGYPGHNFEAFRSAAAHLRRELGHDVISPVEMDEAGGFDSSQPDVQAGSTLWATFLARDVAIVAERETDGVVVLDGWEDSRGAALEVHVARELGKPVYRIAEDGELEAVTAPSAYRPLPTESVLEEAERLVGGDRGDQYGHPADDFARTAGCWRALFGWDVTPERVALAMICVKLSRLVETPTKRDSVADTCGYARTYEMVMARGGNPLR